MLNSVTVMILGYSEFMVKGNTGRSVSFWCGSHKQSLTLNYAI